MNPKIIKSHQKPLHSAFALYLELPSKYLRELYANAKGNFYFYFIQESSQREAHKKELYY